MAARLRGAVATGPNATKCSTERTKMLLRETSWLASSHASKARLCVCVSGQVWERADIHPPK